MKLKNLLIRLGDREIWVLGGVAVVVISVTLLTEAWRSTERMTQLAVRSLEDAVEDQIGYMLHCNAVSFCDELVTARHKSIQEMQKFADVFDVDEINVADAKGNAIATNDSDSNDAIESTGFNYGKREETKVYMKLLTGELPFVKQPFRRALTGQEDKGKSESANIAKYIAVPFDDRSGFVQMGYYWSRLEKEFSTFYFPMFDQTPVGQDGFYLVTDKNTGKIAVPPNRHPDAVGKTVAEIGMDAASMPADRSQPFMERLFGSLCCVLTYEDDVGDWRIYAVLPYAEEVWPAVRTILVSAFVILLLCFAFTRIMDRLREDQRRIDRLRAEVEARRRKEMETSRAIQFSALPRVLPDEPDFKVFAKMTPAREVGGDFYDCYELDSGRIAFTIADVSGKGVPAAMFMMKSKMTLKSAILRNEDLAAAVASANDRLSEANDAEMFITAWVGTYDRKTGEVEFVNAGHNPPLVKRADGSVEWIRFRGGPALAAMPSMKYRVGTLKLEPGDGLFLYTDGVTEAMNASGELFGEARLEATLGRADEKFVSFIEKEVAAFVAGAEPSDDVTELALDRKKEAP